MKSTIFSLLVVFLFSCSSNNAPGTENTAVKSFKKSFEYQAPKPQNGVLMAAIEIGSLGLNYFIVSLDAEDNWELIDAEYGRSNLIFDDKNTDKLIRVS